MNAPEDWTPQYCRDARAIAADAGRIFEALLDLRSWRSWWFAMKAVPYDGSRRLAPGSHFRFDGGVSAWDVEVQAVESPRSLRMDYVAGDLLGPVEWRLEPLPDGGTEIAYIYHGVRANAPRAAQTFGRYGTSFHALVMQADALAGLDRFVRGEPLDESWRTQVQARIAEIRATLTPRSGSDRQEAGAS
jgi:uncharacterized protein YndB with AHSA1/START domain